MLEWTQKSDSLYFSPPTVTCLILPNMSFKEISGDPTHHLDQILFLNYPSFRRKEWDYFLPYWKTYLLPVYSHIFVIFYPKMMDYFKEKKKKKVELAQMVDYLCISSSISFHASLTSQHYNLFELPSVISTPSLLTIAHLFIACWISWAFAQSSLCYAFRQAASHNIEAAQGLFPLLVFFFPGI